MFGRMNNKKLVQAVPAELLSLEDIERVSGGAEDCLSRCANDANVKTDQQLDKCVGQCLAGQNK